MAAEANSTPARPMSVWAINGLLEFTRAAHIAVDDDAGAELFDVERQLWDLMIRRPIQSAGDARGKLDAMLTDLERRDEIDDASAQIVRQVIRWLEDQ